MVRIQTWKRGGAGLRAGHIASGALHVALKLIELLGHAVLFFGKLALLHATGALALAVLVLAVLAALLPVLVILISLPATERLTEALFKVLLMIGQFFGALREIVQLG